MPTEKVSSTWYFEMHLQRSTRGMIQWKMSFDETEVRDIDQLLLPNCLGIFSSLKMFWLGDKIYGKLL